MANRMLLAIKLKDEFESWLIEKGYEILTTTPNSFEVIRARKGKRVLVIFKRIEAKEHFSIMDKDASIVRQFIRERKMKKREAEMDHFLRA